MFLETAVIFVKKPYLCDLFSCQVHIAHCCSVLSKFCFSLFCTTDVSTVRSNISINVSFHLQIFLHRDMSSSVVQVLGSGRRCAGDRCRAASGFSPVILSFFPPPAGEGASTRSHLHLPRKIFQDNLYYNCLQLIINKASK